MQGRIAKLKIDTNDVGHIRIVLCGSARVSLVCSVEMDDGLR